VRERWPGTELTLHFHNTRGMGLANVLAGIEAGADRFDASLGGIGGCPYAPGATGNVCTEEIVHALELMGYDTGVDLGMLLQAAHRCKNCSATRCRARSSRPAGAWTCIRRRRCED
jgi:hydroxymethylglutaryl-CoA lyase